MHTIVWDLSKYLRVVQDSVTWVHSPLPIDIFHLPCSNGQDISHNTTCPGIYHAINGSERPVSEIIVEVSPSEEAGDS